MNDFVPMLAKPAALSRLTSFAKKDDLAFEQKVDGHRLGVRVIGGKPEALNRKGLPSMKAVPTGALDTFNGWPDLIIDGEVVGNKLWLFDLPALPGLDIGYDTPLAERRQALEVLVGRANLPTTVALLPQVTEEADKADLALRILRAGGEGVIVKKLDSAYLPGKRSTAWVKCKYTYDVDCVVTEIGRDGKDNIVVAVYEGDELVEIGTCTALAGDGDMIRPGHVVCVKYLYFTPTDRRLYQPTLPRLRDDKTAEECTMDQLVICSKEVLT